MITLSHQTYTKLNLGSGNIREGLLPPPWLNVDVSGPVCDYCCDIRNLPGEWSGQFAEVRASHVLEHIFLKEWHSTIAGWVQAVEPGGIIRIIIPDLAVVVRDLQRGFDEKGRLALSPQTTTAVLAQIYGIGYDDPATDARWRHRIIADEKMLCEALALQAELTDIRKYPQTEDPAAVYGIKDDSQNMFSLCVQARKRGKS